MIGCFSKREGQPDHSQHYAGNLSVLTQSDSITEPSLGEN